METVPLFSLNGLDKRTRARLHAIAAEMRTKPEDLASAILSEWSLAILEGLIEAPKHSAADRVIDIINCGLIEPLIKPLKEPEDKHDVQTTIGGKGRSQEDQIPLLCHTED